MIPKEAVFAIIAASTARIIEERYPTRQRWDDISPLVVAEYRKGKRPRHIAKALKISKQEVINILKNKQVWMG